MSLAYLTDIIILLAAAVVAVPLARVIGLGTVPGFLLAGILVGPSVLGLIDNAEEIRHLAELGVVLLLFIIGIELKPSRLWLMRRQVFGLGTLQVLVTGALITVAAHFLFGVAFRTAVIVGPALALSSTAFVLQLLAEGKTSKEIAADLNVAPRTIETHRRNIMEKLNRHSASALTAYAIEKGLVDPCRF